MKILVLGGTRYFGKRLVENLCSTGSDVTVASTGKTHVEFSGTVKRIAIERGKLPSMKAALSHLNWDIVYDQICFNAEEARISTNLFSGKIGKLIFTSSQSVYDYGTNMQENTFEPLTYVPNPTNENWYQEGKRLAEQVYSRQTKFPVTFVRFPVVIGPDDHTRRLNWHIARIKYQQPIFFPNRQGKMTVISAEDAALFLDWLKKKEISGPINACSNDPLALRDLVSWIEAETCQALMPAASGTPEFLSSYGVEKDWCASSLKAEELGFKFSKVAQWLPLLVREQVETSTRDDAKIHKQGF